MEKSTKDISKASSGTNNDKREFERAKEIMMAHGWQPPQKVTNPRCLPREFDEIIEMLENAYQHKLPKETKRIYYKYLRKFTPYYLKLAAEHLMLEDTFGKFPSLGALHTWASAYQGPEPWRINDQQRDTTTTKP